LEIDPEADQAGKSRRVKLDSIAGEISATDLKSAATLNELRVRSQRSGRLILFRRQKPDCQGVPTSRDCWRAGFWHSQLRKSMTRSY